MLLLTLEPAPLSIWRWCSGVGLAAQLLVIIYTRNPTRRISPAVMESVNKAVFYGVAVFGAAAMLLQIGNLIVWNRFWPFFALIVVHLIAALAQFVRMVLLPPHGSSRAN